MTLTPPHPSPAGQQPTSAVLHDLAYGSNTDPVHVADILAQLRRRAMGFVLLVFALPCCLPMVPGFPTVAGFIIVFVAFHLIGGAQALWLPRWIARRSMSRHALQRIVDRSLPLVRRVETISRPRLGILRTWLFERVIGIVVLVMGLILILPIPFLGNLPPGFAVSVIGIGLTTRDGLLVLLGLVLSVLAALFTWTMTWALIEGLRHAI